MGWLSDLRNDLQLWSSYQSSNPVLFMDAVAVASDPCLAADEVGVPYAFRRDLSSNQLLVDGELLLVSRHPSLDRHAILALRTRLLDCGKAIRLHPATLRLIRRGGVLLGFEGGAHENHIVDDGLSIHPIKSLEALAEAGELMSLQERIATPLARAYSLIFVNHDAVLGTHLLTSRDTFLDRADAMELLAQIGGTSVEALPIPAILKPRALWTGKQILSCVLPAPTYQHNCTSCHPDDEIDLMSVGDTRVLVEDGELLCGQLDQRSLCGTSTRLLHAISDTCGAAALLSFIAELERVAIHYLTAIRSLSIGGELIDSSMLTLGGAGGGGTSFEQHAKELESGFRQLIDRHREGKLEYLPDTCAAHALKDACLRQGHYHADRIASIARHHVNKHSSVWTLIRAGEMSFASVRSLLGMIGPQWLDAPTFPNARDDDPLADNGGFNGRSMPHTVPLDARPAAVHTVTGSFVRGLKPLDFWLHARTGRDQIVSGVRRRPVCTRFRRTLTSALSDCHIAYDGTVRNARREVVQFIYGDDGMSAAFEEASRVAHLHVNEARFQRSFGRGGLAAGAPPDGSELRPGDVPVDVGRGPSGDWERCRVSACGYSLPGPLVCMIASFLSRDAALVARRLCHPWHVAVSLATDCELILEEAELRSSRRALTVGTHAPFYGVGHIEAPVPVGGPRLVCTARSLYPRQPHAPQDTPSDIEVACKVRELTNRLRRASPVEPHILCAYLRSLLASTRVRREHELSRRAVDWVLREIEVRVRRAAAPPGEMVGSQCAEALGADYPEHLPYSMLFRWSGVLRAPHWARTGLARFEELVHERAGGAEATRSNLTLYLKPNSRNDSEVATGLRNVIERVTMLRFIVTAEAINDPVVSAEQIAAGEPPTMVEADADFVGAFYEMPDEDTPDPSELSTWVLRLVLNAEELSDEQLNVNAVEDVLRATLGAGWHLIGNDPNADPAVIRIRAVLASAGSSSAAPRQLFGSSSAGSSSAGREEEEEGGCDDEPSTEADDDPWLRHVDSATYGKLACLLRAQQMCAEHCGRALPANFWTLPLKGVSGIERVFIRQLRVTHADATGELKNNAEWVLDALSTGTGLLHAMTIDQRIEWTRCVSSDVHEVHRVLGLEAARATLYREMVKVVEFTGTSVSRRHVNLLCDVMTHEGRVQLPRRRRWLVPL